MKRGATPAPHFLKTKKMKLTQNKTKRQEIERQVVALFDKEMASGAMKTQAVQNVAAKLHLGWWQVQYIIRKRQLTAQ